MMMGSCRQFAFCRERATEPFSPVLNLFLMFGIDFHHRQSKRTKRKAICMAIVKTLVMICWILALLVLASYCRYTVRYHLGTKSYAKLRLVRLLEVVDSCTIFCVVHRSRRKISALVREVSGLGTPFHLTSSNFAWTSVLAVATVHSLLCFGALYPHDPKRYRYIFGQFTFEAETQSLTDGAVFCCLLLVFNVLVGLVEIFPFCVVLLYGILCRYLKQILAGYVRRLEIISEDGKAASLEECFGRYDSIMTALHRLEDVMSFPIFLAFAMTFSGILFGILVLEYDYPLSYLNPLGTVSLATFCFGSFAFISCLASGVNEGDKRARQAHRELLKRLLPGAGIALKLDKRLSFLITNCEPAFALTGWGFFHFTKGFLLGAVGCVFTYAFFIANL